MALPPPSTLLVLLIKHFWERIHRFTQNVAQFIELFILQIWIFATHFPFDSIDYHITWSTTTSTHRQHCRAIFAEEENQNWKINWHSFSNTASTIDSIRFRKRVSAENVDGKMHMKTEIQNRTFEFNFHCCCCYCWTYEVETLEAKPEIENCANGNHKNSIIGKIY